MNKFNISELTIDEVNLIFVGLLELPGKYTSNLIPKIKDQLERQGARSTPTDKNQSGPENTQSPGPVPVGPLSNKVIG